MVAVLGTFRTVTDQVAKNEAAGESHRARPHLHLAWDRNVGCPARYGRLWFRDG